MNTERRGSKPACAGLDGAKAASSASGRGGRAGLAAALLAAALAAVAQPATPPVPGQGPGYHDPRSAIPPLQEREGVVSWKLLAMVTTRVSGHRVVPTFPDPVKALDGQKVKLQGFMLPLEPGERQSHFLLSAVPTTCSFCVPAGPEGLVEVRTRAPVRYSVDAVTLEGRLAVLTDDRYGLFYRLSEAAEVR
ncbi:DUF3299 domain-containing protein [Calidifontimicrobium sp. SYSU G02091]|uniref:DUF3299 domain-containing protein n=1 Tax=Calidifontimicrobium sp. SYSU G02091 TaxID=2926421 RepID=UPI001F535C42|nr:DUF3299 domain-containing protein [Calidifontimicrobium sp. SYSU G02091]MCI1191800.1 DUF3299 domain-containing protein [Calidifontimicrobium sp. SYSU G02091]